MPKSPASPSSPTVKPLAASPVKAKSPTLKKPADAVQPPIPVASSAPLTEAVPAATLKNGKSEKKHAGKAAKEESKAGESKEKTKKAKLVRDSFTMPEAEYAVLGEVKKACL